MSKKGAQMEFNRMCRPRTYVPILLTVFLLTIPLWIRNPFYQDVLIMMFFYAGLSCAWNLLGGFAGQISIGHAAFFGIGAYTSTLLYLHYGLSPWIGMFAGGGLAIVAGFGFGIPCFRLKTHFFALATIAFFSVLQLLAVYYRELTKGSMGLLIPFKLGWASFMFRDKLPYVYIALAFMGLVILVTESIKRSRFGFYLTAIREDQDAAESLGVGATACKLIALAISAFFVALGGTFYAQYMLFIDPDSVFAFSISINMALFSIIGGLGTVLGPMLGSFVLTPLEVLLRGWLGPEYMGLNFVIYGLILIIAVRFFPLGIIHWIGKKYDWGMNRLGGHELSMEGEPVRTMLPNVPLRVLPADPGEDRPILFEVKDLTKYFGGLAAVNNVDFQIKQGEILGLIGPNGAGKTTIFNLISGFSSPNSGEVKFKGETITGLKPAHKICLKRIGRTFQVVKPLQHMTVLENVMVGAFSRTRKKREAEQKAREMIDFVGLSRYQDVYALNLTIADRKRLELCRALATEPELLLLDEVISGLNPKETKEVIELVGKISKQGVTLLIIEHIMEAVMSLSDRIIVLNYGEKIAEGTPVEIAKNRKVIEAYLGEEYAA